MNLDCDRNGRDQPDDEGGENTDDGERHFLARMFAFPREVRRQPVEERDPRTDDDEQ